MKKVKLLFKDSDHPSNRDIVAFLDANIDKLNQVGIVVDFRIVADAELPSLRQRGVTKLPILVVSGKKIYERSSEIKDALKQLWIHNGKRGGPEASKRFESGDPDEQMREYMESDLSMDAWEKDDGDEGDSNNHMDKVLAMAAQRTKALKERGSSTYERPTKRGSKKDRKSSKRDRRSSETAVERGTPPPRRSSRRSSGAPTNRDDQLMIQKFEESGMGMDL
jgi:hypothetical protein